MYCTLEYTYIMLVCKVDSIGVVTLLWYHISGMLNGYQLQKGKESKRCSDIWHRNIHIKGTIWRGTYYVVCVGEWMLID